MKSVLFVVVVFSACASSAAEERSSSLPAASCSGRLRFDDSAVCRSEQLLAAAELAEKNRTDSGHLLADARNSIDSVIDPYARAYLRLRLALLESLQGRSYRVSLEQARSDAARVPSASDREQLREHIKRTERACALRAADYLIRTQ